MKLANQILESVSKIEESSAPPYPKDFDRMYDDLKRRGVRAKMVFDDYYGIWIVRGDSTFATDDLAAAGYLEVDSYGAYSKWTFPGDDYYIQSERSNNFRVAPQTKKYGGPAYGQEGTILTSRDRD